MKIIRRILQDPSFWSLILMNVFIIKYYNDHPGGFKTYLWIFWLQSVTIGLFNFLNILTIGKGETGKITFNRGGGKQSSTGCVSFFFLFHYEFFHLVYAIFLLSSFNDLGKLDYSLFKYAALAIFANQLIWFVQSKFRQKEHPVNVISLFFLPYLRIIPMHLVLIIPAFIHVSSITLFLALKMFMDIAMQLVTTNYYYNIEQKNLKNT